MAFGNKKTSEVTNSPHPSSLSISHINAQIAACARRGDATQAEEVFKTMLLYGLRPTRCTFNSIINAHKVRGDMQQAKVWFQQLVRSGMAPNSVTYTMMISGCAEAADVRGAESWYEEMQSRGCLPTEHTLNALIKAYANAEDYQGAEERLRSLSKLSDQMKPNVVAYNIVIQACGSAGMHDRAMHWYKELLNVGLCPTQGTICSLMTGYLNSNDGTMNHATQIEQLTKTMEEYGLPMLDVNYSMVIRASARRGDVGQAAALFEQMITKGQPCSLSNYNSMIHACTQTGNIRLAEHYLRLMEEYGIDPDLISYNTVINACAAVADTKRAEQWFLHMIQRGLKPNLVTYGTICKAYARQGDASSVKKVMDVLEESGLELNEYFFGSLIAAYGASCPPDLKGAEGAFQELMSRGLEALSVKRVLMRAVGEARTLQLLELGKGSGTAEEALTAHLETGTDLACDHDRDDCGQFPTWSSKLSGANEDFAELSMASLQRGPSGKDLTHALSVASKMVYSALGPTAPGAPGAPQTPPDRLEDDLKCDLSFLKDDESTTGSSPDEGEPCCVDSSPKGISDLCELKGFQELQLDSAYPESWRAWRIAL